MNPGVPEEGREGAPERGGEGMGSGVGRVTVWWEVEEVVVERGGLGRGEDEVREGDLEEDLARGGGWFGLSEFWREGRDEVLLLFFFQLPLALVPSSSPTPTPKPAAKNAACCGFIAFPTAFAPLLPSSALGPSTSSSSIKALMLIIKLVAALPGGVFLFLCVCVCA